MLKQTSRKVAVWSIAASILLLSVGMCGAWYVHVLQQRVSWAIADNVPSIRAAPKLELAIREMRHALDQFEISSDRSYLVHAVELEDAVEQARLDVAQYASSDYEFGVVAKINDGLKEFFGQLRDLSARPAADDIRPAVRNLDEEILAKAVLPYTKKYLDFNEAEFEERSSQNETMASRLMIALVLFGICGAAAGVAAGYGLAQGIRRNIYQLSIPLRDVAGRLNRVVGPVVIDENPAMEDLEDGIKKIAFEVSSVIEKFHATHRQIIRADQLAALGQLAAGLAHEMHNPLMCMKILVQSARAEGDQTLDSNDLRVLDEEMTRLQNLLQSFLNFARPAKLERREVDLRNVVSQTITVLAARAARRHISIEYRTPDRGIVLDADEAQLRQITLNLLLNALDAVADNGTIWIDIGAGSRLAADRSAGQEPVRGRFSLRRRQWSRLAHEGLRSHLRAVFQHERNRIGSRAGDLPANRRIARRDDRSFGAAGRRRGVQRVSPGAAPRRTLRTRFRSASSARVQLYNWRRPSMPRLLIVDDEPNLLYSLQKVLRSDSLEIVTAETAREGIDKVRDLRPDVVILDVRLPDMSGLDAFSEISRIDARLPVIMITAYSTMETAIEATKRGAYEYLLKPVAFDQLRATVQRALTMRNEEHPPEKPAGKDAVVPAELIVGQSPAMQDIYKAIGRIAPQDVTVLIEGESGVGKELVAQVIYHHSRRSEGPFLAINCAAIPEPLLESELFGHERGAFTGAGDLRIGKFQQVDTGTLFLDEIGDMPLTAQAKVLRLLQDGSFERVGSNKTLRANVRVVAATNQNLEELVEEGLFRRDLFYRLKVFTIRLPPLRERLDDLPLLLEYFIRLFNEQLGRNVRSVSPEAMQMLMQHPWPGNVRELQSAVKYALVHTVGETILPESLPVSCRPSQAPAVPSAGSPTGSLNVAQFARELLDAGEPDIYRRVHGEVDRILLPQVLQRAGGNQVTASQLLGIARSTLRTRISDLGMMVAKRVLPETGDGDQPSGSL